MNKQLHDGDANVEVGALLVMEHDLGTIRRESARYNRRHSCMCQYQPQDAAVAALETIGYK